MEENKSAEEKSDSTSLESDQDALEAPADQQVEEQLKDTEDKADKTKEKKRGSFFHRLATRLNVYLLLFVLLVVATLIIVFVASQAANREAAKNDDVESQELTQEAIDSLNSNEAVVGDPKQLLTVESNSVFSGSVLVEGALDVAGPIKVGGDLNLPGITVSGTSAFDEVQVNTLSVAGDVSVQGVLTVQQGISVNGEASFSAPISAPTINVDDLQINGDVQFSRHIDAGGSTPSVAAGSAVGVGGTVTISGTDTAGTVTANIGSGASGGTIATITFSTPFSGNPHVVITPVNASAPDVYVVSRTANGFAIRTGTALSAGSISFDYIVID